MITLHNISIKNIVIIVFCMPLFSFAQNQTLTYDQSQDIEFVVNYKNETIIDSYSTKDGLVISVGDTLSIGSAIKDRKKYLFHDTFSHIAIGNTRGRGTKELKYLPHNYSGNKVIVKSLFVTHEKYNGYKLLPKRKELPLYISVFVKEYKSGITKIFSHSRKTILDIEKALYSGEIVNNYDTLFNDSERKSDGYGKYDLLLKLSQLKESGVLTEEEFQEEKKKILDSK